MAGSGGRSLGSATVDPREGTEASPVLMLEFVVPKAVPTGGDWSGPRLTLLARIWLHGV